MGIETGIQLIKETFVYNLTFGLVGIGAMILILITLVITTRDFKKWSILLLPTIWYYHIYMGVRISFVWWILAIIMYSSEILGFTNMYNATIKTVTKAETALAQATTMARHRIETGQGKAGFIDRTLTKINIANEEKAQKRELTKKLMNARAFGISGKTAKQLDQAIKGTKPTINEGYVSMAKLRELTPKEKKQIKIDRRTAIGLNPWEKHKRSVLSGFKRPDAEDTGFSKLFNISHRGSTEDTGFRKKNWMPKATTTIKQASKEAINAYNESMIRNVINKPFKKAQKEYENKRKLIGWKPRR